MVNATHVIGVDATDADQLTKADVEARLQIPITLKFLRKYVPGFENCYLSPIIYKGFSEQLENVIRNAVPRGEGAGKIPQWFEIQDRIAYYVQKTIIGDMTPKEVLTAADKVINEILAK